MSRKITETILITLLLVFFCNRTLFSDIFELSGVTINKLATDTTGVKVTATSTIYLSFDFLDGKKPGLADNVWLEVIETLSDGSPGNYQLPVHFTSDTERFLFQLKDVTPYGKRNIEVILSADGTGTATDSITYYHVKTDATDWISKKREQYDGFKKGRWRQNLHGSKGRFGGRSLNIKRKK
ncbi:hypothetical protein ACFL35_16165 [Candidatus Riflebacteria bacterium]